MRWIRAIPIHKSHDGGPTSNDQMFRSTYEALGEGDLITIFPEGVTVDDPRIANIKTGSARIALGARASGVGSITLLSAGIHYGDKAALRSEVFIDIGYPIDLDDLIGAIFAFLVTWSLWTWLGWRLGGVELAAATVLLSPFYLFALIALAERLSLLMGAPGRLDQVTLDQRRVRTGAWRSCCRSRSCRSGALNLPLSDILCSLDLRGS